MKQISIQRVIAEISSDENAGESFVLQFVRSTGKQRGSIKTVAKALYGAPNPKERQGKTGRPGAQSAKKHKLHLDAGTLPMTDMESGTYFTPLISHIVGYNGMQVIH